MKRLVVLLSTLVFFGVVGCGGEEGTDENANQNQTEEKPESDGKDPNNKADQWNAINNPTQFRIEFDYNYEELKQYAEGRAAQVPWPSDYWSYYEDSINVRYHGEDELSPVEKYDVAFNNWEPNMELTPMDVSHDCEDGKITDKHDDYYDHLGPAATWQHKNKGNWKARNGKDDDNDGETDECGDDYDGIETWWGLCHAWVPAAILEPEPKHPVTVNGVEFTVSDIKALLIAMHDRSAAHMLGGRCNDKEVERDEVGRMTSEECRDTNAGTFHVVITNMLGKMERAFAEDRTAGYQVWNQPVLGYQILEEKEVNEEDAMELLKHEGEKFHDVFDSPEAVSWRYVKMDVDYITESANTAEGALTEDIAYYTRTDHYEYVLEIDEEGNVVGGEWINYTNDTHPDFLWLPVRAHGGNPHMSFGQVRQLLELSQQEETEEPVDETVKRFGGETDAAIPDNDEVGISYTLTVNEAMVVGSLSVGIVIEHTYIGDLNVALEKDGVEVVLHDNSGGGTDNLEKTYDIHDFDGIDAQGDWILRIKDTAGQDTGALKKFELFISDTEAVEPEGNTYSSDEVVDIPDNDEAGISSVIEIEDDGVIRGLDVHVDITHTYIGDLVVTLNSGGQEQILHKREGGSADNLSKTFKVDAFDGAALKGTWKLTIKDLAGRDVGTLNAWSMDVTF